MLADKEGKRQELKNMDSLRIEESPKIISVLEIHVLLHNLGVMPNYRGFNQSAYAIKLCIENPDRLLLVTKMLYPEVSKHFNTKWLSVERNIRTVASLAWKNNPELLNELSGCRLTSPPTSSQFISIIAWNYLNNQPEIDVE